MSKVLKNFFILSFYQLKGLDEKYFIIFFLSLNFQRQGLIMAYDAMLYFILEYVMVPV